MERSGGSQSASPPFAHHTTIKLILKNNEGQSIVLALTIWNNEGQYVGLAHCLKAREKAYGSTRVPGVDQITIKTPNHKCRLYWCLIEFIDWKYSRSCWYFRPLL